MGVAMRMPFSEMARQLRADGQCEAAAIRLRKAAAAGNAEAMAALGEHLLSGPPPIAAAVLKEARDLLMAAARAGNGHAAYLMARMIVSDIARRESWGIALGYLANAAAAGHPAARIELAFLAGRADLANAAARGEDSPPELWRRLREAIDVDAWTNNVPRFVTVSADPFIGVVKNFVTPEICDWIVHWSRDRLTPATSYDRSTGKSVANHMTASPDLDFVVTSIIHRVAALTGIPVNGREGTSVLRYLPGEAFEAHYDFLDPGEPARAEQIRQSGQRLITFLTSLSDDFEGGETDFPSVGYRYKGWKGDAVFFRNVTATGAPDYKMLHAGLAPVRGEKWALVRVCTRIPVIRQ